MKNKLKIVYIALGILSIAYYFVIWRASRLGLSMSGMWIAIGLVLIAAGLLSGCRAIPRWVHIAWRCALCIGVYAVLALECLVISGLHATAPAGMEYLIVLGARVDPDRPSPALTRRLNCVMSIIDDHPDATIIASGGQGPDEPMSEAQCIRDELVKRGVDAGRIVMEDRSTSTVENLRNSLSLMRSPDAPTGIITNNYHVWRATHIAKKVGLTNAHGIAAIYTGFTKPHYMIREALGIVLDRLRGNL